MFNYQKFTLNKLAQQLFYINQLIIKKNKIMNPKDNTEHREGELAKTIENQTAKLPSDLFLWAALGSMVASAILQVSSSKKSSLFVGQWAAPFLLLGVYNKLVKLEGHDSADK